MHLQQLTLLLMRKMLPKFNYISFASESILNEYKKTIDQTEKQSTFVIQNSFPQQEFVEPSNTTSDRLEFVWFSQHIDKGRGLEKIIPLIHKHSDKFQLTLFGNCNPSFKKLHLEGRNGIYLGGVLTQLELHQAMSKFDVGLAIEDNSTDKNRNLCLTNKILAYYQSGLYILASETIEQKRFLNLMVESGTISSINLDEIEELILQLYKNIIKIRENKLIRYDSAKCQSWENISNVLTTIWHS